MRRFEYKDSRSYKFWEIDVEGSSYTVRYGKVGSKGASSSKSFATPVKAQAEADKKIKSKVGKGYAEVAVAAPAADSTSDGPKSEQDWAVRADELQAAGDPWGERISVFMQWEQARGADKRKYKKRLDELDAVHGEDFYGEALLDLMQDKQELESVARLEWDYGYIARARLRVGYDHSGPSVEKVLAALVASPAAAHMERLVLGRLANHSDSYVKCLEILGRGGLARLEYLFVGEFSYPDETEISWVTVGDLGKALSGLPALRTLRARGGGVLMSNFKHAKLRRLEIESGGIPPAGVRGFADADLPELVHASLWLGTPDYGGTDDVGDLDALWHTPTMPKLQHLGLQNSAIEDDIADGLCESKILAQLSSVDLSMGTMRAEGAQALIANADKFRHLKSLNVDDNFIPAAQRQGLRDALGEVVQLGSQRVADQYDDEEWYYTAVSE